MVIEDEDDQRKKVIESLQKAVTSHGAFEIGPRDWPAQADEWLVEKIEKQSATMLLDLELSELPGRLNSETFFKLAQAHGGLCLIYTSRQDGRLFEHRGEARRGGAYIVLQKGNALDETMQQAWGAIRDFAELENRLSKLPSWTPVAVLASCFGISPSSSCLTATQLKHWFSTPLAAMGPAAFAAGATKIDKRKACLQLAYWLRNVATFFPGVLASDQALASYLGISPAETELVAPVLAKYEFTGPFAAGTRYWFMPPIMDLFGPPGDKSAKAFQKFAASAGIKNLKSQPAGYYCPIGHRPIRIDEAAVLPAAPADAHLTRTSALEVQRLKIRGVAK